MISIPVIKDPDKELSGCCSREKGLPVLHKIHRTLPRRTLQNEDEEVLQDETARPILDEISNGYIYDDLKATNG